MKKFPSSLRSRIFLTSAMLAVLSVVAAVYLVSATVIREAENGLQREITATGAMVNELRTTRAQTFTTMARVIADAPPLKAAVATNDPATVQDVVDDFPAQLNSNLLLVTSRTGQVLGTVGFAEQAARTLASDPAVRDAAPERETTSLIPQPDGLLQLITVPIVLQPRGVDSTEFLGTLSVGFRLDQALAAQLKEITGSEVAFGVNGQILATTLPAEDRPALVDLVRRAEDGRNVTLRTEEYMALPVLLSSALVTGDPAAAPVALILRSRMVRRRRVAPALLAGVLEARPVDPARDERRAGRRVDQAVPDDLRPRAPRPVRPQARRRTARARAGWSTGLRVLPGVGSRRHSSRVALPAADATGIRAHARPQGCGYPYPGTRGGSYRVVRSCPNFSPASPEPSPSTGSAASPQRSPSCSSSAPPPAPAARRPTTSRSPGPSPSRRSTSSRTTAPRSRAPTRRSSSPSRTARSATPGRARRSPPR